MERIQSTPQKLSGQKFYVSHAGSSSGKKSFTVVVRDLKKPLNSDIKDPGRDTGFSNGKMIKRLSEKYLPLHNLERESDKQYLEKINQ